MMTPTSDTPRRARSLPIPGRVLAVALAAMAALACAACASPTDADAPPLTIGVAASLRPVAEELAAGFDGEVVFVAGSSGSLAAQVRQGAPVDALISADARRTAELADEGLLAGGAAPLARGELVAVTPLAPSPTLPEGAAGLAASDSVRSVALANPELAPYGAAALRYLRAMEAWDAVSPKAVYGENVAQTLTFAASGNADVAFVPLSLWLAAEHAGLRRLDPLPDGASAELVVTAGVVAGAPGAAEAERFLAYAASDAARAVWERHGFAPPPAPVEAR